jgi:hypothetical protein
MVPSVEVLDVSTSDDLDHRRNAPRLDGRDEEVYVIGHQDVGVNRTLRAATRIVDDIPVHLEIQPIAKNRAAVCSAVDDVKRYSW